MKAIIFTSVLAIGLGGFLQGCAVTFMGKTQDGFCVLCLGGDR